MEEDRIPGESRLRAEQAREDLSAFEDLLLRLAQGFVGAEGGELDVLITRSLEEICEVLGLQRASVWQGFAEGSMVPTHATPEGPSRLPSSGITRQQAPWLWSQLESGHVVRMADLDAYSAEASVDAGLLRQLAVGGHVLVPLRAGSQFLGVLAFGGAPGRWVESASLARRLEFVGAILATALARHRTQEVLLARLEFEEILSDLSAALSCTTPDALGAAIEQLLARMTRFLKCHRGGLVEFAEGGSGFVVSRAYVVPGMPMAGVERESRYTMAWYTNAIRQGRPVVLRRPLQELPEEALEEREWMRFFNVGSHVIIPISVRGKVFGSLSFGCIGESRDWPDEMLTRLGVVGDLVANAMEQLRSEAALRELRSNLAHASRVLTAGELTAAMAHELNQPLTAILSNADAGRMLLATGGADLQEMDEILVDVAADAERAAAIIRRLREFMRRGVIRAESVDLASALEDVGRLMANEARLRRATLGVQIDGTLPPVWGDRVQLQQIVVILVMNALEALEGVAAGPREVCIACHGGDAEVVVAVDDNGPGLLGGTDRIFEVFHTTKPGGMGVGLPLARTIAEAHGGRLRAVAKEAPGARFELGLPIR